MVRSGTRFGSVVLATAWIVWLQPSVLFASNPGIPWECSTYEGDAQARCLNAFIELQQDKIEQLEEKLHAQQGTMSDLQNRVDRQAAATADLQRQLSEKPLTTLVPPPYLYPYVYPPTLGFGLHFGRPGFYGKRYFYGPRPFRPPGHYRRW